MSIPETGGGGTPAPAVARAVRILDFLAGSAGRVRTLSEIARELGVAKSSTLNLCAALEEDRLIRKAGGGYLLGRRTVELGIAYLSAFDQVREFYRICEETPDLSHHLVQIAMLDGPRVLYLAVYEGQDRFPMSASVGDQYPASVTAVGTALLSELPPSEVESLYQGDRHLVTFTEKSTASLKVLQAKLQLTRDRGYALDEGEVHPSVVGVAVVIPRGKPRDTTFAIGLSLVSPHNSPADQKKAVAALKQAAEALQALPLVPEQT